MPGKIAIISPAFPLRGGISSLTERLAQQFEKNGWQVTIYSFRLQYPSILFPGKSQYVPASSLKPNLNILTVINAINPLNWVKVGLEIKNEKFDLILMRYWLPFISPSITTIAKIAVRNSNTKVITIADNIIPHESRPFDKLFTRYLINNTDGFLVMSNSVKKELTALAPSKQVEYVAHPIYDNYGNLVPKKQAREKLNFPHSAKIILFFGFIRDYKGLDLLIEALAMDIIRELNIQLVIAGEFYNNKQKYTSLIKNNELVDSVHIVDAYISHDEVKFYFGATDMVVQPYKTATQSGISQLAFHFEKPMLVTSVGGLSEIVIHNRDGYVVNPKAMEIAQSILDFYKNNREAAFIKGVKESKKRFSWNTMVDKITELNEFLKK